MNEWFAPAAILGLLGVIGTLGGITLTRRNNKDTLLLSSRDEHIDDLRESLKDTNERLDKLSATVSAQAEKIQQLETREWGLRRFVVHLIDFIKSHGLEPPDPPENLKL